MHAVQARAAYKRFQHHRCFVLLFFRGAFLNMAASTAHMTDRVKAQCFALRNPPQGQEPMKYTEIAALVVKADGTHPTEGAVRQAVASFSESTDCSKQCWDFACTCKLRAAGTQAHASLKRFRLDRTARPRGHERRCK